MMVCGVCRPNFASPFAIAVPGNAKDVAITAFARSRLIISSAFAFCLTEGHPSIAVSAPGFGQGFCGPAAGARPRTYGIGGGASFKTLASVAADCGARSYSESPHC